MSRLRHLCFALLLSGFAGASAQAAPNPPGFTGPYDIGTWNTSGPPSVIFEDDQLTVWLNGGGLYHGVVADGWTLIDWSANTADSFHFLFNGQDLVQGGTFGTINQFVHAGDSIGFHSPGRAVITYFNIIEDTGNPVPNRRHRRGWRSACSAWALFPVV